MSLLYQILLQGASFDARLMTVAYLLASTLFCNVERVIHTSCVDKLACFAQVAAMISDPAGCEPTPERLSALFTIPLEPDAVSTAAIR